MLLIWCGFILTYCVLGKLYLMYTDKKIDEQYRDRQDGD